MKLAIIGVQHGHVLGITRQILAEDDTELVVVAEPEHGARERVARDLGVPGISDYRSLLDGSIDAAVLAPINSEKGDIAVTQIWDEVFDMDAILFLDQFLDL